MENKNIITTEHSGTGLTVPIRSVDRNGMHSRDDKSLTTEPPTKRMKVETNGDAGGGQIDAAAAAAASVPELAPQDDGTSHRPPEGSTMSQSSSVAQSNIAVQRSENGGSSIITTSSSASHSFGSHTSLPVHAQQEASIPNPTGSSTPSAGTSTPSSGSGPSHLPPGDAPLAPLKSRTMNHLGIKYLFELEYMLREFRKLERQLLGAKGAAQLEESAGSRERREKLHSFILHLEDTVRQIEVGCSLEAEGKSTIGGATDDATVEVGGGMAECSAMSTLTREKEEEENVQKLEEHILANLLPVKIRLKKQLAAQQGASKNPPGMPAPRRGNLQPSSAALGKGTFVAAAEERRKQAEAARLAAQEQHEQAVRRVSDPTQFGKPLRGGGSSLTQKLHGATLGSKQRSQGHGVGSTPKAASSVEAPAAHERKILYAGMVPQSKQHQSGVTAASGVHELVIEDPNFMQEVSEQKTDPVDDLGDEAGGEHTHAASDREGAELERKPSPPSFAGSPGNESFTGVPALTAETLRKIRRPHEDETLTEDERRKLRKKRRKRKLRRIARRRERDRQRQLALHQQAQAAQGVSKSVGGRKKAAMGKAQGKKKGPRAVEYICALCSEAYSSTCDYNPWWALAQHECPKCRKTQVPRIDISSPANAIEYHPALLAHADDNGGGASGGGPNAAANVNLHVAQPSASYKPPVQSVKDQNTFNAIDSESESDLSELSDGSLSDDSMDSDDSVTDLPLTAAEQAEHETFGHEYKGPVLVDEEASRLLVLMAHASTCPCRHKLTKHRDVCKSTKYMMLHVRDCPGTTSSFDVCPFPWCRKVKHLLYHLVSCTNLDECSICSSTQLSSSLQNLVGLNSFRLKKHRQRMIAATKAASSARVKSALSPIGRGISLKVTSKTGPEASQALAARTKLLHPYQKTAAYLKSIAPGATKAAAPAQRVSVGASTSSKTVSKRPAIIPVKLPTAIASRPPVTKLAPVPPRNVPVNTETSKLKLNEHRSPEAVPSAILNAETPALPPTAATAISVAAALPVAPVQVEEKVSAFTAPLGVKTQSGIPIATSAFPPENSVDPVATNTLPAASAHISKPAATSPLGASGQVAPPIATTQASSSVRVEVAPTVSTHTAGSADLPEQVATPLLASVAQSQTTSSTKTAPVKSEPATKSNSIVATKVLADQTAPSKANTTTTDSAVERKQPIEMSVHTPEPELYGTQGINEVSTDTNAVAQADASVESDDADERLKQAETTAPAAVPAPSVPAVETPIKAESKAPEANLEPEEESFVFDLPSTKADKVVCADATNNVSDAEAVVATDVEATKPSFAHPKATTELAVGLGEGETNNTEAVHISS